VNPGILSAETRHRDAGESPTKQRHHFNENILDRGIGTELYHNNWKTLHFQYACGDKAGNFNSSKVHADPSSGVILWRCAQEGKREKRIQIKVRREE
jgi:hypothetical protein